MAAALLAIGWSPGHLPNDYHFLRSAVCPLSTIYRRAIIDRVNTDVLWIRWSLVMCC